MTDAAAVAMCRDRAVAALRFARRTTLDLLRDFPEDRITWQETEGEPHVLWILGHLAVSDEWIEGMIQPRASRLPSTYKQKFGHNSRATAAASDDPPWQELIDHFQSTRECLIEAVHRARDEQLLRPLGDEGVGFADDPLDAVNKTAWHEGWHAGQLSRIRRAIGLTPIFP